MLRGAAWATRSVLASRAQPAAVRGLQGDAAKATHMQTHTQQAASVPRPEEEVGSGQDPLTDSFGRKHTYLRISLTEKCNLRCQYCMPAEGVTLSPRSAILSADELVTLATLFARLGVEKMRLTGGEPTVRRDLVPIVERLSGIAGVRSLGITTNGLTLTRQLVPLQRAGLTALNISLDTLRPDRYEKMARRKGLERVLAGIDLALQLGYNPVKVNCVLMKGFNEDEIADFAEFTKDRAVDIRFIEFMPFSGNKWEVEKLVSYSSALARLRARYPTVQQLPVDEHHTSKPWRVPGHAGSLGFITSMTQHFCYSCNRIRLTADGNLKVCLFGAGEVSLRDALRSGADQQQLSDLIAGALATKKHKHADTNRSRKLIPTQTQDVKNTTQIQILDKFTTKLTNTSILSALNYPPISIYKTSSYAKRFYSTSKDELSHLDADGRAKMVDVGTKIVSERTAIAECSVRIAAPLRRLLVEGRVPKGDVLTVAKVAGILAAKKTAQLIPMCHPLPVEFIRLDITPGESEVRVECEVRFSGKTGVEMEALTGAAVAALTFYDMCKSVDKSMCVTGLRVRRKTGGKTDVMLRPHNTEPLEPQETFAPTNVMHL